MVLIGIFTRATMFVRLLNKDFGNELRRSYSFVTDGFIGKTACSKVFRSSIICLAITEYRYITQMKKNVTSDDALKQQRHGLVGPAHLWESKRLSQFDFLKSVGLMPHHRLLDLGCGTLRGGIPLIEYLDTSHYFGFDVRENVIQEAHKELKEYGLESKLPTLACHDSICEFSIDQKLDYVWAYSVLIHMTDEVLGDALDVVCSLLAPGGKLYANVNIGPSNKPQQTNQLAERNIGSGSCRVFPLIIRPLAFYQEMSASRGLLMENLGTTDTLYFDPQEPAHKLHTMFSFSKAK